MNNKSKLSELVIALQREINTLESQATEIGYERIVSLADFIDQKHDGVQLRFCKANDMGASHVGKGLKETGGADKFIVVGDSLYRLAKEVVV